MSRSNGAVHGAKLHADLALQLAEPDHHFLRTDAGYVCHRHDAAFDMDLYGKPVRFTRLAAESVAIALRAMGIKVQLIEVDVARILFLPTGGKVPGQTRHQSYPGNGTSPRRG